MMVAEITSNPENFTADLLSQKISGSLPSIPQKISWVLPISKKISGTLPRCLFDETLRFLVQCWLQKKCLGDVYVQYYVLRPGRF